jgi:hypothetical protein
MPHVTQDEARVLAEAVRRRTRNLIQLRERMEETGRKTDPLYAAVKPAHEAMHALWVRCHHRSCGADRPPKKASEDSAEGLP